VFHGNLVGRTVALGHLACARWVVGDRDRALDEAQATIDLAVQLQAPILIALGHVVRARLRYLRRDPLAIAEAEAAEAVRATALDTGMFTEANAFALWTQAQRSPLALAVIEPMLGSLRLRLTEVSTCSTLVALVLIDVLRSSGHTAEARQLTDDIIAFAVAHNERVYLPELLRVRGEQRDEPESAAQDFREAQELARSTGAGSLEQRATESLAAIARPA